MARNGHGCFFDTIQYMNWIPATCEFHMLPMCKTVYRMACRGYE
jgi:hypothetical protein